MDDLMTRLVELQSKNSDFFIKQVHLGGMQLSLCGFDTLMDFSKTLFQLQSMAQGAPVPSTLEDLAARIGGKTGLSAHDVEKAVTNGKLIAFSTDGSFRIMLEPVPASLHRSVSEPQQETVLMGPHDAFQEDIHTNGGMLRDKLKTDKLIHLRFTVGKHHRREISMFYLEDQLDKHTLEYLGAQLQLNEHIELDNLQNLAQIMGHRWWNPIPTYLSTELPIQAVNFLKRGRIILFVDGFPYAFVFPKVWYDMFCSAADRQFPHVIMYFIRVVRVISFITALILPGLYVALVSVNPDVLKIQLALSVAQSRVGIPYPALFEVILIFIIIEMVVEAIQRLPSNIGTTITMVGGIILGEAVVQAELISNLLIIVLAATTIASFALITIHASFFVRLAKYFILAMAALYGILGVIAGLLVVAIFISHITSVGQPYTEPWTEGGARHE
ncbi:spore germination protein [Paenibacillus alkalitolerans]|uniref:spore germination protein n=1 Tax=Paenibacillus alkalitolerans TaxID=2799335 RepID=UPI0018F3A0A3|nr:spore germination protein [Paenibacillus alkalitolerans]